MEKRSVELRKRYSEQSYGMLDEDMRMEVGECWYCWLEDTSPVVVGLEDERQMKVLVDTSDESWLVLVMGCA